MVHTLIVILKASDLLVLLVVVDLGVPEEGLRKDQLAVNVQWMLTDKTHLVTVSPEVVLGPDVLEGVLGLVLKSGAVGDVLPVLGPEPVGVDTGEDDGGDHNASCLSVAAVRAQNLVGNTRWKACARCLWKTNCQRCAIEQHILACAPIQSSGNPFVP